MLQYADHQLSHTCIPRFVPLAARFRRHPQHFLNPVVVQGETSAIPFVKMEA